MLVKVKYNDIQLHKLYNKKLHLHMPINLYFFDFQ